MRWTRISALLLMATLALAATACGSSSPSATTNTTASPGASPGSTPTTTATTLPPVSMPTAAGTFGTAPPTVTVPTGAPPTVLEASDLITGTGPAAKKGDMVSVQYVLVSYATGQVIQSSWTASPFSFTLGVGQVIPGWDQGVVGMKAGGRRELVIPPALAYGATGQPPTIPANATLIFIVDCLKIS